MGHDSASNNAVGSHERDQVVREGGGDQTISVSQNVAQVSNVAHLGITTSVGVLQVTESGREGRRRGNSKTKYYYLTCKFSISVKLQILLSNSTHAFRVEMRSSGSTSSGNVAQLVNVESVVTWS